MSFAFEDLDKVKKGPSKKWTQAEIDGEIKKLDEKLEEAKTSAGDVEVRDAILDKAQFYKDEARDFA
jgi:hypothetical protein